MIKAEKLTFGFSSNYLFQGISFNLEENCHCTHSHILIILSDYAILLTYWYK